VDLLATLQELHAKEVDLYLHQQGLDTSTPSGRAMFGMMGVFAEFERSMIQERVKAGLARAGDEGVTLGRPTLEDADPERAVKVRARSRRRCTQDRPRAGVGVGTVLRLTLPG
jgi:DNA invertase Pin-like site-specific DNA recombinase